VVRDSVDALINRRIPINVKLVFKQQRYLGQPSSIVIDD
jgi:hypothetical protein